MIFKIIQGKEIHVLNRQVNFEELLTFVRSAFKKLPKNFMLNYIDAEGDAIALSGQSDIEILYLNQSKTASVKIMIEEIPEELNNGDSFDELEEEKPEVPKPPKVEEKIPEPVDVASLVQSRLNEILPEISKKVTEDVTNSIRSSQIRSEAPKESQVVHDRVTCDGCGMFPVVGHRYKCIICHNFDFCEACEAKGDHPHAFLKIRKPEQAPKVLVASMDDAEREGVEINGKFMDAGMIQSFVQSIVPNIPAVVERFKGCFKRGRCGRAEAQCKKEDVSAEKVEKPEKAVNEPLVGFEDFFVPPVEKKVE